MSIQIIVGDVELLNENLALLNLLTNGRMYDHPALKAVHTIDYSVQRDASYDWYGQGRNNTPSWFLQYCASEADVQVLNLYNFLLPYGNSELSSKARHLRSSYNVNIIHYLQYGEATGWVCELNPSHLLSPWKSDYGYATAHNDHNHITGKWRGLLCCNCNSSLGLIEEDFEAIVKMLLYIKQRG